MLDLKVGLCVVQAEVQQERRLQSDKGRRHGRKRRVLNLPTGTRKWDPHHSEAVLHTDLFGAVADLHRGLTTDRWLQWRTRLNKRSDTSGKVLVAGTKKRETHNLFSSLRKSMAQSSLRLLSISRSRFLFFLICQKRDNSRRLFEWIEVRTTQRDAWCISLLLRVTDEITKVSPDILNTFLGSK